ncbi:hypothetical protein FOL47_007532 [Perkinsus chesapeaki]|uniref:RBR-type E3 ubiquitin transferase n=1 Tax=Perkinsus chesapeaki TaxID=330153 RepID=A0A7J6LJS2_PERCH|nr:hypothetical protein FOL47_007532 [Perkinsus chesapeaki]
MDSTAAAEAIEDDDDAKGIWEKFLDFRFKHVFQTSDKKDGDFIECPHPGCEYAFLVENKNDMDSTCQCPLCKKSFCPKCYFIGGHTGMSYEAVEAAEQKEEEATDALAKDKGWRKCPVCGVIVSKEHGCNFMWCSSPQCRNKTNFCYVCGDKLTRDQHYSHFPKGPYENCCDKADLRQQQQKQQGVHVKHPAVGAGAAGAVANGVGGNEHVRRQRKVRGEIDRVKCVEREKTAMLKAYEDKLDRAKAFREGKRKECELKRSMSQKRQFNDWLKYLRDRGIRDDRDPVRKTRAIEKKIKEARDRRDKIYQAAVDRKYHRYGFNEDVIEDGMIPLQWDIVQTSTIHNDDIIDNINNHHQLVNEAIQRAIPSPSSSSSKYDSSGGGGIGTRLESSVKEVEQHLRQVPAALLLPAAALRSNEAKSVMEAQRAFSLAGSLRERLMLADNRREYIRSNKREGIRLRIEENETRRRAASGSRAKVGEQQWKAATISVIALPVYNTLKKEMKIEEDEEKLKRKEGYPTGIQMALDNFINMYQGVVSYMRDDRLCRRLRDQQQQQQQLMSHEKAVKYKTLCIRDRPDENDDDEGQKATRATAADTIRQEHLLWKKKHQYIDRTTREGSLVSGRLLPMRTRFGIIRGWHHNNTVCQQDEEGDSIAAIDKCITSECT